LNSLGARATKVTDAADRLLPKTYVSKTADAGEQVHRHQSK